MDIETTPRSAQIFAAWLRPLYRQDWIVYLKPPFGGPQFVPQYLGPYTHRVAISNHRLVSFADGNVTLRWRDSADHNEQKLLTLSLDEFLRRFLLHVLPKVSCASVISVFWTTDAVPPPCPFAFSYWAGTANRAKRLIHRGRKSCWALSPMRWAHEGHRKAGGC